MSKIRILVVDDSSLVRRMVSDVLATDPALEVVGTAPNGKIALAKIPLLNPDLIILDILMPEMDGLETLAAIRKRDQNIPVIMYSVLTELGAIATIEALSLGATDYLPKPQNLKSKEAGQQYIREQLIPKIKLFSPNAAGKLEYAGRRKKVYKETQDNEDTNKNLSSSAAKNLSSAKLGIRKTKIEIVAIGSSTGGPNALEKVLSQLPANFPVPIVIAQHMPPVFTKRLAERLTQKSKIRVAEGVQGGTLAPGQAWIAPGDYHMVVEKCPSFAQISLNQNPPENSCRPAVDVLFRSVAKNYGANALVVVLTGMGQDGLIGCQQIKDVGGQVIVQDEKTSVVWGMPGIVANSGLADQILPLGEIASEIIQRV